MKILKTLFNLYFFFVHIMLSKIAKNTARKPIKNFISKHMTNEMTNKLYNDKMEQLRDMHYNNFNLYHASGFMCLLYFSINITIVNIISKYIIPLYDLFEFEKIIIFVLAIGIIPHYYFSIKNDNYNTYFRLFKQKYVYYRTKIVYLLLATLLFFIFCYCILI